MLRDVFDRRCPIPGPVCAALLATIAGVCRAGPAPTDSLASLSFEELAEIRITSVSRKAERLADAAAAVFVIRAEDIRRAGAASLPEALRLAPNLEVARIDARSYAISARGFNTTLVNKLLVLIDGRTIYTPLYSGVFWDAQDVVLEDIDRIEVISGPGATLWGANAVNGVINVITRSAAESQGGLFSAGAGARQNDAVLRYGGQLAGGGHYRVYGKHAEADDGVRADGLPVRSGWRRSQAGFRTDLDTPAGALTVQGDAYQGMLRQRAADDAAIGGANLLARLTRSIGPDADWSVQTYLDYTTREQAPGFREYLSTLDLEWQRRQRFGAQQLVWGGGYRVAFDRVDNGPQFAFLPADRNLHWVNLFAQDEVSLTPRLRLTAGLRAESNSYTGIEYLPSLSLAWQVAPNHLLWSQLTRAVRAPARIARDFYFPAAPTVVNGQRRYLLAGGADFVSETAQVAQLGYRAQPAPKLSWAATVYYSEYDRLRSLDPTPAGLVLANSNAARARGIELTANWEVRRAWRLMAALVAQRHQLRTSTGSPSGGAALAINDPGTYAMLRSSHDLSDTVELDMTLRHQGSLPQPALPAYNALDLRLGWRIRPALALSLQAQNLLGPGHAEFGALPGRSVFERTFSARLSWQF